MEEKRKYLEYFDGSFDSTVADKRKPENWPYVAYSKEEGVVYTENGCITKMVLTETSGGEVQLSANGLVIVEYMQNGEKVRNTYSALSNTHVPIPAGVEATVYGVVTDINRDANGNVFSWLDLSKNTALTYLDCSGCTSLTSLDLSKNVSMNELYCTGCESLTSLDVSNCVALTELYCTGCESLTSLDVSKNVALTYLECNGCVDLTSLDVSKNVALTYLSCSNCTGLTSLDVSNCVSLTELYCDGCTGLMLLDIQNTSVLESGIILDQSMANLTTLQLAGTSAWAYEQVESWLSKFAPDGGMIYVDENTPQAVITAAEAKEWEVIYVS